jgi:hypothetical protein
MVRDRRPAANGATRAADGRCFAEFGATTIVDSQPYRTCIFSPALVGDQAFYVRTSDGRCGCSEGTCTEQSVAPFVVNVPESSRSYSSVWAGEAPGTGHAQSKLNSPTAWSAGHDAVGEWMQMDLGETKQVAGVVMQRRHGVDQWVETFTVQYTDTPEPGDDDFTSISGTFNNVGANAYVPPRGSSDHVLDQTEGVTEGADISDLADVHIFEVPVTARYIRVLAATWYGWISLRAAPIVDYMSYHSDSVSLRNAHRDDYQAYSMTVASVQENDGNETLTMISFPELEVYGNPVREEPQVHVRITDEEAKANMTRFIMEIV